MTDVSPVSSPETNRGFFFGVRFMRRLSIGVKLWATTGILALPLVGLGVFYVHSLSSTLFFTATEQRGYTLFRPLDAVALRLERREELDATALARHNDASATRKTLDDEINAALAAAVAVDVKSGNAATHAQIKELQSEWQSLESAKFDAPQPSMEAHDKVIDTVGGLTAQIAADYDLALDPELAAYNLIDVTMTKLPDARRALLAARAHMASMFSGGEFVPVEGGHVAASLALLNDRMNSARDEIKTATTAAADRPALTAEISALNKDWNTGLAGWSDEVARSLPAGHPAEAATRASLSASDNFAQSLNSAQDAVLNAADKSLDLRHHGEALGALIALSGSAVALTLGIILMLALSGRISGAVKRLLHISTRITEGEYDNRIDQDGTDEISKLFAGMSTMQQTLASQKEDLAAQQRKLAVQIEGERALSIENGRIRSALDNVSGCVMVADGDWKIIYTNTAVVNMLRGAEVEIRKQLPTFRASAVLGSSLDIFHKNPDHQRKMLAALRSTHVAQVKLGACTFRLTVNPVLSPEGVRIGTVLEWADRTGELTLESETKNMLDGVLSGDLSRRIGLDGKSGFFEALGRGMNRLVDNMHEIIAKVKLTAREVHNAAEEISLGNANLSQRTEQQSASLEETASSMEEITATVKQNADNARQASQLASAAREQAQAGGTVVSRAVTAMADINDSSKKIANIIGVIDEIAFQTNLLALNAAVEAARAGEQGRGFAVVASEVRSLAGRSAAAAKEIKELIKDSVAKVEGGTELVAQSGQTLDQIVVAVKKVTDVVAEIASASGEQTTGIEQINLAITQMDEMTQQNAALVEQATAASQSMAQQAGELTEMLSNYRTEAGARPAPAHAEANSLSQVA